MATTRVNPPNPEVQERLVVPSRQPRSDYPLIDNDPHFKRVVRYMRGEDYAWGAFLATIPPVGISLMEKFSPSYVGRGGFAPILRLNVGIGLVGGFILAFQKSSYRFYGITENQREVEMDMREMVDRAKRGEPLYGKSSLTEEAQQMAARNSRHSAIFLHIMPFANFVNHKHHGVDTAKYYQQAERELEAERIAREG
ncbi:putative NADH-ubiquinone oxidoreductase 21 kDa subunit [Tothia fuscella]|uniref:NADH-ubiquinone oxidoreductase 21 kDa subunit n=1 Tax=Tothia fuscella TaxID=1048955 RepID=A0A9P4NW76_9PEZI|nr:putative NADH-ubiquinone oxidoreductase 21 kDa subunit [Tothia fuscella]